MPSQSPHLLLMLAMVWQLKGVRWNTDTGRCLLCLGENNAKHVIMDCWKTRNWRFKFLNDEWLNTNKKVAYRNMVRCANKDQVRNLGRYLDIVKCN